ncbi:MAG: hypothetical protein ACPLKZ_01045 [Candidatus Bathyarchaeales archaeon]
MSLNDKELVEILKIEWKRLWSERLDDKVRAEGIATTDYRNLFVERGLIIHATKDYKALSFKEILEQHQIANADRYLPPPPQIGGWTKFIKTHIANQQQRNRGKRAQLYHEEEQKTRQQLKKGGRGWLHL